MRGGLDRLLSYFGSISSQYAQYPDTSFQSLLPKLIPEMERVTREKGKSQQVAIPPNAGLSKSQASKDNEAMMSQDEFVSAESLILELC
jgi:hypothetical protein